MANYFINFKSLTNGVGSLPDPFNNMNSLEAVVADDDVCYIRRTGSYNMQSFANGRFTLSGKSNIKFTTYYNADGTDDVNQPKPEINFFVESIAGDWTEVSAANPTVPQGGSNLWILSHDVANVFAPIEVSWFGPNMIPCQFRKQYWNPSTAVITAVTAGNAPSIDYQYDWFKGTGAETARLIVYSVGNPVTYYNGVKWADRGYRMIFAADNCNDIIYENISFKYTCNAFRYRNTVNSTTNTGNIVRNCDFNSTAWSFNFQGDDPANNRYIEDFLIEGCDFRNSVSSFIRLIKSHFITVRSNNFYNAGYGESIGMIYTSQSNVPGKGSIVEDNTFDLSYSGRYFPSDGGGVLTDFGSNGWVIENNKFTRMHEAWHDNSGRSNEFHGNLATDCNTLSVHSDSSAIGASAAKLIGNTAIVDLLLTYNNTPKTIHASIAFLDIAQSGTVVKNNVVIGPGTGAGLRRFDATALNIDEDYNTFNSFSEFVIDELSNPESAGANTNADDPLYDSQTESFPVNSTVIGNGVKAWSGVNLIGYKGEPFSDFDTDRGHIQSTFGPFHPVNL